MHPPRKPARPDSPQAWLMAMTAFLASFVTFGVTYSFGVFFKPIGSELHASRATTSALFSIAGLASYLFASFSGQLSDQVGPRLVVGAGALVMGVGLVLTASIHHMWAGYLTYGLGVGVGSACAYIPTLAIVGGWFVKRRNTALGLAASGTGCGTLLAPPIAAAMIERYGWRTTYILFGIVAAVILGACALAVERPPLDSARVKRPLGRVVRSPEFMMLYASWLLATTALYVPFLFLPSFARDHGAGQVASASLLSLIGGVSIIGRLGIGFVADRLGTLRLFQAAVLVMGVSYAFWLTLPGYGWLIVFVVVLGLGYGARISLMPGVLIELFGMRNLGGLLGVFFTSSGFSSVLGPLLAAVMVDYTGHYQSGIIFALVMGLLGFAVVVPLLHSEQGWEESAAVK